VCVCVCVCVCVRAQGDDFYYKSLREWVVVGASQLALIALDWRKFLLYVWAPHFFAQWGIVTMNMLQHDGCDMEADEDSSVECTTYNSARNFVGPVINYLTFNNGYHTIHHMYPTMHWSRLAAEHEAQVEPKNHPGLNQQCMARYIFRAFIFPGLRVDYLGNPVVLPPGSGYFPKP
jgi:fatty acid desaturase